MILFSIFGWGTWIRTKEMSDSESDALPLGDIPIAITLYTSLNKIAILC